MRILIKTSQYSTFITTDAEHMLALVNILPHLRVVESSGYGESLVYKMAELPPEMMFEPESKLEPLSPREASLAKALEEKTSNWVSAFTERDKFKDEVKILRAKLEAMESQS